VEITLCVLYLCLAWPAREMAGTGYRGAHMMSTLQDGRGRDEFLAAFADVYKPDAVDRWGRVLIMVLLVVAEAVALGIAYACGAQWGL